MTAIKNLISNKYTGLVVGLAFTAVVVTLLIFGHASKSVTPVQFVWETRPVLHICDTAPEWIRPGQAQFEKALKFLDDQGASYASVEVGPCDVCELTNEAGVKVQFACVKGMVAVDLMVEEFQGFDSEKDLGKCVYASALRDSKVATSADWTTILVPSKVLGPDFWGTAEEGEFSEAPPDLPPDAEALVFTHESGHCLLGLGHNLGPSLGCGGGCRLNPQTGNIMNPNTLRTGWRTEGFTPPPWK